MKQIHIQKKQKGLTLIELLIGLGVVLAILVVGFVIYTNVTANQRAQAGQSALLQVVAGVQNIVPGPNFDGINAETLIRSGKAPANMINGIQLFNQWGGAVTIASTGVNGGTDNAFTVTFNQVPRSECNSIVSSVQSSFPVIAVGSSTVKDAYAATPVVPTVATITTACDNESNNIVFTAVG